jgi:heme oxygenase
MRYDVTMDDYVDYLCKFYGYYSVLEPRLIAADSVCGGTLHLSERRKLPWLKRDIGDICGRGFWKKIPLCESLPGVADAPAVMGCCYVVEGSTLGAMVIGRHLHACLGVTADHGARFVHGYGDRTMDKWKHFINALNAANFSARQRKACIDSAIATFDTLRGWLAGTTAKL